MNLSHSTARNSNVNNKLICTFWMVWFEKRFFLWYLTSIADNNSKCEHNTSPTIEVKVWHQRKIIIIFSPISRSHELLEFESLFHFGILDYTNCTYYYVIYSEISVVRRSFSFPLFFIFAFRLLWMYSNMPNPYGCARAISVCAMHWTMQSCETNEVQKRNRIIQRKCSHTEHCSRCECIDDVTFSPVL